MKTIALDNDYEFIWPITRKNASTGVTEPAAGLAGLTATLSASDGGPAINGALTKTLVERAQQPGEYAATLDGDVIRAQLASYAGKVIYEVVGDGVNIKISAPRFVTAVRTP